MLVLFDNNVPGRFSRLLLGHEVKTAFEMGWAQLQNGNLIRAAEEAGFPVIITADKNMAYQQNLEAKTISVITLRSLFTDYVGIAPLAPQVLQVLETLGAGEFISIFPGSKE